MALQALSRPNGPQLFNWAPGLARHPGWSLCANALCRLCPWRLGPERRIEMWHTRRNVAYTSGIYEYKIVVAGVGVEPTSARIMSPATSPEVNPQRYLCLV